jgi:adenylosuccinate synthase
MPKKIVLLSGSVASGKTTLWRSLKQEFDNVHILKTKELIQKLAKRKLGHELDAERRAMQLFGDRLDTETQGSWVRDELRRRLAKLGPDEPNAVIIVDAVRKSEQIRKIRESYGYSVVHVHLKAPKAVLSERYTGRASGLKEFASFAEVATNRTEARIEHLEETADVVLDTSLNLARDVAVRAATHLGFYARDYDSTVDVIVGGQYGSEGKGHIASYLAREYDLLVRVGGPNAGHSVFLEPTPYIHHQLPSGTLRSPLATLLIASGAVLNADLLIKEISECRVDATRLFIDPQAMIIGARDISGEAGLKRRISSTGQGVGLATARRILDRGKRVKLAGDVKELRPFTRQAVWEVLEQAYRRGKKVLVEGTQGCGLSLYHGEYPFVTSRDTTVGGCLSEAGISASRVRKVIMVCRTFPIRVQDPEGGTSGPLYNETSWEEIASKAKINLDKLLATERTSTTNRSRRVGRFDWVLLRKAAALNGPTDIALTFADYIDSCNDRARRYEQLTEETMRFIEEVERVAAAPVSLISTRFDFRSIIDRRSWW